MRLLLWTRTHPPRRMCANSGLPGQYSRRFHRKNAVQAGRIRGCWRRPARAESPNVAFESAASSAVRRCRFAEIDRRLPGTCPFSFLDQESIRATTEQHHQRGTLVLGGRPAELAWIGGAEVLFTGCVGYARFCVISDRCSPVTRQLSRPANIVLGTFFLSPNPCA